MVTYSSSRYLFEDAREAARDAERIGEEIRANRERMTRLPSPSLEAHGRHPGGQDMVGRAVSAAIDRGRTLRKRLEYDNRLIDAAYSVLYGRDGEPGGLASIAPVWWADAIYHHYLELMTWKDTGRAVCYHPRYVQTCVAAAFELCDANGLLATVGGQGMAEG